MNYYLAGRHFILVTDHALLQRMAKAKDNTAKITYWFLSLQDILFQVRHHAGNQHGNSYELYWWYTLGPFTHWQLAL